MKRILIIFIAVFYVQSVFGAITWCTSDNNPNNCTSCISGKYCITGDDTQKICKEGYYCQKHSVFENQESVILPRCLKGYYCPAGSSKNLYNQIVFDSSVCSCGFGKFSSGGSQYTHIDTCHACPDCGAATGDMKTCYYNDIDASSNCDKDCDVPKDAVFIADKSKCEWSISCSLGEGWGGRKCEACPEGTYNNIVVTIVGSDDPWPEAMGCDSCAFGTYAPNAGMSACDSCKISGKYTDNKIDCNSCSNLGQVSVWPDNNNSGSYSSGADWSSDTCIYTPPTRSPKEGCASTNPINVRWINNVWIGPYYEVTANAGYYVKKKDGDNHDLDLPECVKCGPGQWNADADATSCEDCTDPDNTEGDEGEGFEWTSDGNASDDACKYNILSCAANHYKFVEDGKETCKECKPGYRAGEPGVEESRCIADCSVSCLPVASSIAGGEYESEPIQGTHDQTQGDGCYLNGTLIKTGQSCRLIGCRAGYYFEDTTCKACDAGFTSTGYKEGDLNAKATKKTDCYLDADLVDNNCAGENCKRTLTVKDIFGDDSTQEIMCYYDG